MRPDNKLNAFAETAETLFHDLKIPGASYCFLVGGKRRCQDFGVRSSNSAEKVTGNTKFPIGSITKTFVALAIMRLKELEKSPF